MQKTISSSYNTHDTFPYSLQKYNPGNYPVKAIISWFHTVTIEICVTFLRELCN